MIPFRVSLQPGVPIYEQVVYAAKKAIIAGEILAGDRFPSVRVLSQELKINPNTAHKVISELVDERLLEIQPGLGAIVAKRPSFTEADRARLVRNEVEHLVVEAKRLGLELDTLIAGIVKHWRELETPLRRKR